LTKEFKSSITSSAHIKEVQGNAARLSFFFFNLIHSVALENINEGGDAYRVLSRCIVSSMRRRKVALGWVVADEI